MNQTFLHVGCGNNKKSETTSGFNQENWIEKRVDINPDVSPDIVADMLDLSIIPSGSIDAVYSSHNIEHLYPYQVNTALKEFYRVLNETGYLVLTCPNIKALGTYLTEDKPLQTLYESNSGPVTAIDILYGFRPSLALGNHHMAHKCGFTKSILIACLKEASFMSIACIDRGLPFLDIWTIASKHICDKEKLENLARDHFPI